MSNTGTTSPAPSLRGPTWGWWRKAVNHGDPHEPNLIRPRPPATPGDRNGQVLRLATWNLELCRRLDGACRIIAGNPHLAGADILALQEADEEAVERIAGDDFAYAYYPSAQHPTTRRNFGPAILSRWPILEHHKVLLPYEGRTRALLRVATCATIQVGAMAVRCYSIHLGTLWEMTPSHQDAQARAIAHDAEHGKGPVLIIGDLNRRGAGEVFVRHGYQWVTRDLGRTHLFWSFDHVFAKGLGPSRTRYEAVSEGLKASDHKAVWAEMSRTV